MRLLFSDSLFQNGISQRTAKNEVLQTRLLFTQTVKSHRYIVYCSISLVSCKVCCACMEF